MEDTQMEKENLRLDFFFIYTFFQAYIIPLHIYNLSNLTILLLHLAEPLTSLGCKIDSSTLSNATWFFLHLWKDTQTGGPNEKYVFLNWNRQTQMSSAIWQKNHYGFLALIRMGVDDASFPRWLILSCTLSQVSLGLFSKYHGNWHSQFWSLMSLSLSLSVSLYLSFCFWLAKDPKKLKRVQFYHTQNHDHYPPHLAW